MTRVKNSVCDGFLSVQFEIKTFVVGNFWPHDPYNSFSLRRTEGIVEDRKLSRFAPSHLLEKKTHKPRNLNTYEIKFSQDKMAMRNYTLLPAVPPSLTNCLSVS